MTAVVIDVETTGLDTRECRIVEIAIWQFDPPKLLLSTRIDPVVEIPEETSAVHGIRREDVVGMPLFSDIAQIVRDHLAGAAAWIGHNVFFDRDVILSELSRCGMGFDSLPPMICTKRIWDLHEPRRNLQAAFKRFVDKKGFEGAHGAAADSQACLEILREQISQFGLDLSAGWGSLDPEQKTWYGSSNHVVWAGDGEARHLVVNFGKNKGTPVHKVEHSFWAWVVRQDFPPHVKELADWMMIVSKNYQDIRGELARWAARRGL